MRRKILLGDRRSLIASFSYAKPSIKSWIVFVPESGSEFKPGRRDDLNWLVGRRLASHFNILCLNKPGQSPRRTDAAVFERSFRRRVRVADALTVMKRVIPADHEIFLIGYSEGAYLAPQIARRDRRVVSVVIVGGGTRGWLREEWANARGVREKRELRRVFREIKKRPSSAEKWNAFSFATWWSYREDATLKALRGLRVPVLAILGAKDRTIDLRSTVRDLKRLKNVRLRVLRNCGHEFTRNWPQVKRIMAEEFGEL